MSSSRKPSRGGNFRVTSCDCSDCRAACSQSPGWFMPNEVPRLARHLGLELKEVFQRYLAVGVTSMPDRSLRHGIMPHKLRDGKKPGAVWTLPELAVPGRCVFFDKGKCTIHPVRPYECARMIHGAGHNAVRLRHVIVQKWDDVALKPYKEWTGKRLFGSSPGRRP